MRMRSAAMQGGFALVEVMVAASLIILCLTGIYTMQAQGMMLLRQGRNAGATSQMLQQRVEQLRGSAYSTVTSSTGLANLMNGASATMPSELELVGVRNLTETITVFPYYRPSVTPPVTSQSFTITRINRVATGPGTATSLGAEPQVKAHLRVSWTDREGNHQREFTTVLSSGGLSASGISTRP